jgi:hypothetical protein
MGENCEKWFFANNLVEELYTKWRFGRTVTASNTSKVAGHSLQKTMISTKASL